MSSAVSISVHVSVFCIVCLSFWAFISSWLVCLSFCLSDSVSLLVYLIPYVLSCLSHFFHVSVWLSVTVYVCVFVFVTVCLSGTVSAFLSDWFYSSVCLCPLFSVCLSLPSLCFMTCLSVFRFTGDLYLIKAERTGCCCVMFIRWKDFPKPPSSLCTSNTAIRAVQKHQRGSVSDSRLIIHSWLVNRSESWFWTFWCDGEFEPVLSVINYWEKELINLRVSLNSELSCFIMLMISRGLRLIVDK